jgi:hypothetical protein
MKKNKLVYLLIVMAGLLALYFSLSAYNKYAENKKEKEEEAAEIHLSSADSLTRISYTDGSDIMTFVYEDDTWYYDDDHEIPIKQGSLSNLSSAITGLTAVREIEDHDELSDYGLSSPQYEVSYIDNDGNEHTLHIGDATGDDYYAYLDEEDTVYTIGSTLIDKLQFDLSNLVENDTVPSINSSNLTKVEVTESGEATSYTDSDSLTQLAGGFGTLSLTNPVSYDVTDSELEEYGLTDDQKITVKATYTNSASSDSDTDSSDEEEGSDADSDEETFTVYLGKETSDGYRYIMVDGSKMVYEITTELASNMMSVDDTDE